MRKELEQILPTYKVSVKGDVVLFESEVEGFEGEYPLSFLMELYKHNLLLDLFVLPAIVPN